MSNDGVVTWYSCEPGGVYQLFNVFVVAFGSSIAKRAALPLKTWIACGFGVAGVGFLELAGDAREHFSRADLFAFGQPLLFGLSFLHVQKTMARHPDDARALASYQCLVIFLVTLVVAAVEEGAAPWRLDWGSLVLRPTGVGWTVVAALLYTGLISTAGTIWLQGHIFKRLPAIEASIILTTAPLWAALIGSYFEQLTAADCVGGSLILGASAINTLWEKVFCAQKINPLCESSDSQQSEV
jgi:drug/metabolite transporter (DMT)-like permease